MMRPIFSTSLFLPPIESDTGSARNSREQLDNLLRLDRELGEFFDFLDRTVGKGRWTMMLSADHGVLDAPEDLIARGEYGHRLTPAENAKLDSLRARADSARDKKAAARELVASLEKLPIVADAWTHDELARAQTDTFAILQQRSMWPGRMTGPIQQAGCRVPLPPGNLRGSERQWSRAAVLVRSSRADDFHGAGNHAVARSIACGDGGFCSYFRIAAGDFVSARSGWESPEDLLGSVRGKGKGFVRPVRTAGSPSTRSRGELKEMGSRGELRFCGF